MREYLLFRLYAPLSAWGDIGVGTARPSAGYPSKSAVLGLLAAALGWPRDATDRHAALAAGVHFGVMVHSVGTLLIDYHTVQVPSTRRKRSYHTRRQELQGDPINTVLSEREYRCDASYIVALWAAGDERLPLADWRAALEQPRYPLYLGRKSCPPALPLQPQVVSAATLREAFACAKFAAHPELPQGEATRVHFEGDASHSGYEVLATTLRRDQPLSRDRWQFAERIEHRAKGEPS